MKIRKFNEGSIEFNASDPLEESSSLIERLENITKLLKKYNEIISDESYDLDDDLEIIAYKISKVNSSSMLDELEDYLEDIL